MQRSKPAIADPTPSVKMRSFLRRNLVPVLGIATLMSMFTAAYFAGQTHALRQTTAESNPLGLQLPTLDATSSVSSEKFSMATGFVSGKAEALFVLDHNSGLLQCSVMYPRAGKFWGLFTINVHDILGADKNAQYMMTTGLVDLPSSNNNPYASSVVYVLNSSSGTYACYAIPFNQTMMNSNKPQQGNLILIASGTADPVIDRNTIR